MKKETLKEFGKFNYDIAKIVITLAVVGKFIKDESVSVMAIFLIVMLIVSGSFFINQGAKDE